MARGGVWHNKFKIREQEGHDDFSSECAHLTGHLELVASDIEWLAEQLNSGCGKTQPMTSGGCLSQPYPSVQRRRGEE